MLLVSFRVEDGLCETEKAVVVTLGRGELTRPLQPVPHLHVKLTAVSTTHQS